MEPTMFLSLFLFLFCSAVSAVAKPVEGAAVDAVQDPTRASVLSVLATAIPAVRTPLPGPQDPPPSWYLNLTEDVKSLLPLLYPKSDAVNAAGTLFNSAESCSSTTTITKTLTHTAAPAESSEDCTTTTTSTSTKTLTFTVTAPLPQVSSSSAPTYVSLTPVVSSELPHLTSTSTLSLSPSLPIISEHPTLPPYGNGTATAKPTGILSGSSQAPSATSGNPPQFTAGVSRVAADYMVMGVLGAGGIWLGMA